MDATAIILLALKASIILSVFAIGLEATFAHATFLFRRPAALLRALLSMNVLMPFIALLLAGVFDLNPAVEVALVVISVSPIPPVLPHRMLKAGGTRDYIIGLLVAVSVLSIVVIPLTMKLFQPLALKIFQRTSGIPLGMRAESIAFLVLATILAPLLLGIAVRKIVPTFAARVAKPLSLIALVLIILSALPILMGVERKMFSLIGDGTLLSLSVFALAGFVIGHLLGGPKPEDRPVLGLATATRHPAVALAIAHANFPNQKLAVVAVVIYLIVSAILSGLYLKWAGRRPHAEKPVRV